MEGKTGEAVRRGIAFSIAGGGETGSRVERRMGNGGVGVGRRVTAVGLKRDGRTGSGRMGMEAREAAVSLKLGGRTSGSSGGRGGGKTAVGLKSEEGVEGVTR